MANYRYIFGDPNPNGASDLGFRVASVVAIPEPSSLLLAALASAVLLCACAHFESFEDLSFVDPLEFGSIFSGHA